MPSKMRWVVQVLMVVLVGIGMSVGTGCAQEAADTLTVTTRLVVLDATVLDRQGNLVMQPLGKDDFQIEESKKPQTVYSFESAADHAAAMARGEVEKAPALIFVLDEVNYAYDAMNTEAANMMVRLGDEAYERNELLNFMKTQPEPLRETAEVLVLTHHGFRILVQPTRDKSVLMERVKKHDPGLWSPYRDDLEETGGGGIAGYALTRTSMQAVWSLALEERGVPGHKLVIWLGLGAPNEETSSQPAKGEQLSPLDRYVREITDALVDARITMDVFRPGGGPMQGNSNIGYQEAKSYRFDDESGFTGYVLATGGQMKGGNDVRGEIQTSVRYGSHFYTMSYRPTDPEENGEFRPIRVTVKGHPEWTVLTKAGYYAMQFGGARDAERQLQNDLSVATFEALPFSAIEAKVEKIERIQGTEQVRFTFLVDSDDLQWDKDSTTKKSEANLVISGAALGVPSQENSLTSRVATWKLDAPRGVARSAVISTVSLTMRVPEKTRRLRFVVQDMANGRMGSVDLNPAVIAEAP